MKRVLSIIIALTLAISVMTPILSYAGISYDEGKASLLQEDIYESYDTEALYSSYSTTVLNGVKEAIYEGLSAMDSQISTKGYGIAKSDFNVVYTSVINDNPDLFYVSSSYSYGYNTTEVTAVYPLYSIEESELDEAKEIYNYGIRKAVAQLDDSMSDVQKALVIHDYICSAATYPDLGYDSTTKKYTNDKNSYHSAYGFFLDQNVVCAGYALAYSAIMHEIGIECKYVISDTMGHAWNAIKIDGNWYNVDLTYDELTFTKGTNLLGMELHHCFMKSDDYLKTMNGLWHKDFKDPDDITCTSTDYDDYFWNGNNTNIAVIDGDYYYLDYVSTEKYAYLMKRDKDGNTTNIGGKKYKTNHISSKSSGTNATTGETETIYFTLSFSKLVYYQGNIYISYLDSVNNSLIARVDKDTGELSVLETPAIVTSGYNFVTGFGIYKNELYYVTYPYTGSAYYSNYVDINRMSKFENYYNASDSEKPSLYDVYFDCNNDGVINSKDYAIIYKTDNETYY